MYSSPAQPAPQGLYDGRSEHDACGVAFVATLTGQASHDIVDKALTALRNLEHRGASGSEPDSGDGAGILIQVPDAFLRANVSFRLPERGHYAVGVGFLPADPAEAEAADPASQYAEDVRRLDGVLSQRTADSEELFRRLGGRPFVYCGVAGPVPLPADLAAHLGRTLRRLVAEFGLRFIFAVLFISTLSFLGLGIQPPLDQSIVLSLRLSLSLLCCCLFLSFPLGRQVRRLLLCLQ